ncbi:hypothetical protein A2Y85_05100 [candidate division WOR-3 bacterium RBG_13_43_14]|uniref:peptidylprolyl isomerase n=1 Tax=candidate division WOR-3 bacterium RBG_13_43_14 TaxID=1802590 RepID=A0A1F4U8B1_UNCW3|nr:MAG: hypothetical protein A2Y85_05100 [candidate division WOR-3 bacterium RBG_13_43_14]
MNLILLLVMVLPNDYINLVLAGDYTAALEYCEGKIDQGKALYTWEIERADLYFDKMHDFAKAVALYDELLAKYKKDQGWLYYRLALAREMKEDFLNAAKAYEIVATKFRKPPLDSFALTGVERCFKKNYQDYVATVDGYAITRLELDEQAGKSSGMRQADERGMLDNIILSRLIFANALKERVPDTDEYRDGWIEARRAMLIDEVRSVHVVALAEPTEKEMKKYYKANKQNYLLREEIRGKELIVESESLATVLLDSLIKDMASFDTLAKQYSTAFNGKNGGNFGVLYRGTKPAPLDSVLFAAPLNEIVGVYESEGKYGVYLLTDHKPDRYRTFDEVRAQLVTGLRAEKMKSVDEQLVTTLRKKAKIETYFEVLSDSAAADTNPLMAVINGFKIFKREVVKRNQIQPQFGQFNIDQAEEFVKLIDLMIDDHLKIELGELNKYYLNDGYINAMKNNVRKLFENGLYKKIVLDPVSVEDNEVELYYKDHNVEFRVLATVRLQEIIVETKKAAEDFRKIALKIPDKFDSLATEHSIAPTAKRGGDTGVLRKKVSPDEFDKYVFDTMDINAISKVFKTDDGKYRFVKLIERTPEYFQDFETVKEHIKMNILREKQRNIANDYLAKIKTDADIKILLPEPAPEGNEPRDNPQE